MCHVLQPQLQLVYLFPSCASCVRLNRVCVYCPELSQVDLKYGFLYDSYRAKFYFWESVILLEKLALVMSVTLLQRYSAPLQILVAMAVIFVATAMQVRPTAVMSTAFGLLNLQPAKTLCQ